MSGIATCLFRAIFLTVVLAINSIIPGCTYVPSHPIYKAQYAYVSQEAYKGTDQPPMQPSPYFFIALVNARHLDYSDVEAFFHTLVKHPSDGSKNRDFGHAWIYLQGVMNDKVVAHQLGHSGELGLQQARYFDGVMNLIDFGYSNPTPEQIRNPQCHIYEPNPIKYLWSTRQDGFCQKNSGGHKPTYAVKVDLTYEQFYRILAFIDPKNYDYPTYAITGNQCSSFVVEIAALAGLQLDSVITIPIKQECEIGGRKMRLWEDSIYASITLSSPDILEKSMVLAVQEGRAQYALDWALSNL